MRAFANNCGAQQPLGAAQTTPATVAATHPASSDLPPEVKGWSWGAFWLNWIWAIFNKVWIGLLALAPIVGVVMIFVLGAKGREWAWKAGGWQSLEHFNQVQRRWNIAAWIAVSVSLALGLLAGFAGDALERYRQRAAKSEDQELIYSTEAAVKKEVRQPTVAPQNVAINTALQQIIQPKMLNATLKYLESKVGPAREVFERPMEKVVTLTYEIGGCDVMVYSSDKKTIAAFAVSAEPQCNVDLSPFFGQPTPPTAQLTLANLNDSGLLSFNDFSFYSDCIYMCGNAVDPSIYLHWEGPRALGFLEVAFEYVLASDAAIAAADKLEKIMMQQKGEEWVMSAMFNCSPGEYAMEAAQLFAHIRP